MLTFRYRVRTPSGQFERGAIECPAEDDAVALLHDRDLTVLALTPTFSTTAATSSQTPAAPPPRRRRRGRVVTHDLIVFGRSLATMLDAGLPLLRALETMEAQAQAIPLQDAMHDIGQSIRGGSTFREAIARHPKLFSKLWVSLIEIGEASGQLTKVLEQITIHLEKVEALQRKVVSALAYPCILVVVSIAAISIFILKIIPAFGQLFSSFGATLPAITQFVLYLSKVAQMAVPLFLVAAGAIGFALWRYAQTSAGRWQLDGFLLRLPLIGHILQGTLMASFATSLGTMLKAGVPILHSLEITIAATGNTRIARVIEEMRLSAREGRSLADPLKQQEVFPPMVTQMIAVGEETGKLSAMLDEISKFYEEQVATQLERATALLEPALLLGMGSVIGFLLVSMYLPIFRLSQTVRG
ncbi:MAG: hypothetical protein A3C53_02200 [Omnitrophica WOR_2 bacterium RIFCSPHIGHO2_02_FULL_68_15]|nr:MAG: hypothetical protein A3C53_02200 [Omnitrophica WOR_2 bacterium RIFCSPHIGHO2_02_FULL_68_15]